jgi:hypothetical protein
VGSLFISTLGLGTVALKEPYGDFGGWQKYKGGFSYWTGSKHEFVQLQRRVYDDLKLSLHAALFDSYAVKSETCKALFSAFATLPPPPDDPADHLLLEALYRWRVWDWDRFGLVKQFAVDEGYFADAESFDNRFEDYKKWLSEPRPDETGVAQPRRILADSRPAQVRGLFRLDLPGRVYRGAGTSTPRQVSPRPTDVEVALQSLLESLNETHKTLTSSYSVVSDYAWDWMVRSTTNENKVES